jgi:hypothetical protein
MIFSKPLNSLCPRIQNEFDQFPLNRGWKVFFFFHHHDIYRLNNIKKGKSRQADNQDIERKKYQKRKIYRFLHLNHQCEWQIDTSFLVIY